MTEFVAFRHDQQPVDGTLFVPMPAGSLVPVETMPCPECGGDGLVPDDDDSGVFVTRLPCPRCKRSGTVPIPWLHVSEQRCWDWKRSCMEDRCPAGVQWLCPRRLAGLWVSGPPTVLPILSIDDADDYEGYESVVIEDDGSVWLWTPTNEDNVSREPWAQSLEPGMVVWRFDVTPIEAVTEMVVCGAGADGTCIPACPPAYCRSVAEAQTSVPLSLEPLQPTRIEVP